MLKTGAFSLMQNPLLTEHRKVTSKGSLRVLTVFQRQLTEVLKGRLDKRVKSED